MSSTWRESASRERENQTLSDEMYRCTKVGQAVETAGDVFGNTSLPVGCELQESDFIEVPARGSCDEQASWLGVYREDRGKPWRTAFLCQSCKKEVQRLKVGRLQDGESLVLVKDWRT